MLQAVIVEKLLLSWEKVQANGRKFSHVVFFSGFFFLFYLALGASVFSAIESPIEHNATKALLAKREEFIRKNPSVLGKYLLSKLENNRGIT